MPNLIVTRQQALAELTALIEKHGGTMDAGCVEGLCNILDEAHAVALGGAPLAVIKQYVENQKNV